MRLLTYSRGGKQGVGLLGGCGRLVYPAEELGLPFGSMNELVEQAEPEALRLAAGEASARCKNPLALEEVRVLAPFPTPNHDMICLGLIYLTHAAEAAKSRGETFTGKREYPVYFVKRTPAATGDGDELPWMPGYAENLGYGVELVVVIGKEARKVPEDRVHEYIFGYTIANDVTAREITRRHYHPFFGKSLDGYNPMGPWVVTADEFAPDHTFALHARVNGELRQSSTTDYLTFSIPYIISELSQGMTLPAGTLISTGSPGESDLGFASPAVLRPGDVVECEIEGIGVLRNAIGGKEGRA